MTNDIKSCSTICHAAAILRRTDEMT